MWKEKCFKFVIKNKDAMDFPNKRLSIRVKLLIFLQKKCMWEEDDLLT